jgi:putative PIG3 family NAD(P)H quinone oxidoreductase
LKKLFAASRDARFLLIASCSRASSSFKSAMRSVNSSTESKDKSCPISCVTFFLGRSSSSLAIATPHFRELNRLPAGRPLANQLPVEREAFLQGQIMEKLPAQMTVVAISKPGGPDVLVPEARPLPQPGPDEILIKVAAAGVNRPDVAQRSGHYPPPPGASDLPGLEVAGEVVAVGGNAKRHKLGDKVMSLVAGGGYAQYCIAQDAQAIAVPPSLSMLEAGAIPETLMTVWHNVFERGKLQPGETLLIHGGSSGIGTTAIQLAKAFGSKVVVTVGSKEKADACLKLGADRAINYKAEDFVAEVKAATSGTGADVILDMVGGDYIERNYEAAAVDGRIVQIAFLGGPKAHVNFTKLMVKRLTHTGSTLRPRSNTDKAAIVAAIEAKVMPLLRQGQLKPLIDRTFPLEKAAEAHRRMESGEHIGKIVLAV